MAELTSNKLVNCFITTLEEDGENKGFLVSLKNSDGIQESVDWIEVNGEAGSIIKFSIFKDLRTNPITVLYKDENHFMIGETQYDIPSIVIKISQLLFPSSIGGKSKKCKGKSKKGKSKKCKGKSRKYRKGKSRKCRK